MLENKIVSRGWHDSFGWLRRPEYDEPFGFCYETPDGERILSGDPRHRDRAFLARFIDRNTGKPYVSFYYEIGERNGRNA